MRIHYVFQDFRTDTCQGDRSVIAGGNTIAFLKDGYNICPLPLIQMVKYTDVKKLGR